MIEISLGRLGTVADVVDSRVRWVTFGDVPSVVSAADVRVGEVAAMTSRSAARSTRRLRERVEPAELPRLIELGREIKRALETEHEIVHPLEPELREVYGVISRRRRAPP